MRRIGLAVTIALAVAVPTAGASTIPQRYFSVSVKGVQTTISDYTHESTGPCDPSDSSHGTERFVFHTIHPKVVEARYLDILHLVAFGNGKPKDSQVDVLASVTRHSQSTHGAVAPNCTGSGGGGKPLNPDCGTLKQKLTMEFSWLNPRGFQLGAPEDDIPIPPFINCPVSGASYPDLIKTDTRGKPIYAHVPEKELFDPGWRGHIVVGSGRYVSRNKEGGYTTVVRWEVDLRAVRPPGHPHAKVY